jgi:hypothetical protein
MMLKAADVKSMFKGSNRVFVCGNKHLTDGHVVIWLNKCVGDCFPLFTVPGAQATFKAKLGCDALPIRNLIMALPRTLGNMAATYKKTGIILRSGELDIRIYLEEDGNDIRGIDEKYAKYFDTVYATKDKPMGVMYNQPSRKWSTMAIMPCKIDENGSREFIDNIISIGQHFQTERQKAECQEAIREAVAA